MKTVTFIQACTVYPDGKTPEHVEVDVVRSYEPDYADLLIAKGHAVESTVVPAEAPAVTPMGFRLNVPAPAAPQA